MSAARLQIGSSATIELQQLDPLFNALRRQGFDVVGPTVRDGAVVYDRLASVNDLPAGWTDEQDAGKYRLKRRADSALFGYAVGPHSWKKFLHPPVQRLWSATRKGHSFQVASQQPDQVKFAFIGVRACELHAIAIQDKVFLGGRYVDPVYKSRRENIFVVAVHCGQAGGACFCVSMKTGPKAAAGYDIAMTEVLQEGRHFFVMEAGTERGAALLSDLPHEPTDPRDSEKAERIVAETARQMGRHLDPAGLKELLYRNSEHPRWDDVAKRCLTCANCTMVCPTCFCATVEDVTDLTGEHAERWRKWDSCFTMDFSYIAGGSIRNSERARYRQWMTHKLAAWIDQFGASGCVGCGRCIAWCPAAIDLTEEVRAIRETDAARSASASVQKGVT
jgi:formate hydrogenlyase subunit 6/NADH:ubiquinone oxidoreductase subunit I